MKKSVVTKGAPGGLSIPHLECLTEIFRFPLILAAKIYNFPPRDPVLSGLNITNPITFYSIYPLIR